MRIRHKEQTIERKKQKKNPEMQRGSRISGKFVKKRQRS